MDGHPFRYVWAARGPGGERQVFWAMRLCWYSDTYLVQYVD